MGDDGCHLWRGLWGKAMGFDWQSSTVHLFKGDTIGCKCSESVACMEWFDWMGMRDDGDGNEMAECTCPRGHIKRLDCLQYFSIREKDAHLSNSLSILCSQSVRESEILIRDLLPGGCRLIGLRQSISSEFGLKYKNRLFLYLQLKTPPSL